MEKLRRFYRFLKSKYDLLSLKKYTTLAGTLVFFLIMSIVPLSFWLSLLIGKLPIDMEQILGLSVFSSVKKILLYVQREATNATAGVTVVLLVSTLYSSTNLFYQMRRSGEIIYEYPRPKQGLKLRAGALVLMLVLMALLLVFVLLLTLGTLLFSEILPSAWETALDYLLLGGLAFALALLLNMYICPYKAKTRDFLGGAALTVAAWAVTAVGFAAYLKISNMEKLYGALSAVIVFFLWLYVLMLCFIAGVIFNSEKITEKRKRENQKRKRRGKKQA